MSLADDERTRIVVNAPIAMGLAFAVGYLLDWMTSFSAMPPLWPRAMIGVVVLGAGLALGLHAVMAFRRAGTTFHPAGGSTTIVGEGPYDATRNPMYVALALAYVGAAFIGGRVGPLLALPFALWWIDRHVVAREEAYLERKFGETYVRYKARVRRWL